MAMTEESNVDHPLSNQGYLDLIKASWILIDVIARHPQLNLLDTAVRCDVELLAEVSFTRNRGVSKTLDIEPVLDNQKRAWTYRHFSCRETGLEGTTCL